MLPAGTGLNVNFPDQPEKARWTFARIGTFSIYDARFVADLPAAIGKAVPGQAPMPGLFFTLSNTPPTQAQRHDEAAVARSDISVSVMQVAYDAPEAKRRSIGQRIKALLHR